MKNLKKFLSIILITFSIITTNSFCFASNNVNIEQKLDYEISKKNVFEFIGDYLLSEIPESYKYIELYYNDIDERDDFYETMQKIIYAGIIPNKKINLELNSEIKALYFFSMIENITGYDLFTQGDIESLSNRNTKLSDIILVQNIIQADQAPSIEKESDNLYSSLTTKEKEKMAIFFSVYKTLQANHYDSENITNEDLIYGGIKGLASGTDDQFTTFFPPSEAKEFEETVNGEFEGIGAYVEMEKAGILKIISPISGTPSEKAGLKGGDIITKVDDFVIQESTTVDEAISKIKGKAGTKVILTINRNSEIFEVEIIRELIEIKEVEYKILEDDFFYIQMKMFGNDVYDQFKESLEEAKNSQVKKIIIDLRNNPGGYLNQVSEVLDLFLAKGEKTAVIKTKNIQENYYSKEDSIINLGEYEVYILANSGTASASEIMIGTLKDYFPDIKIIGETTYGKGSVQTIVEYYDGSTLKYTIARWFTGKNEICINKIGINPDIEIELDIDKYNSGEDNQLDYILNNY